MEDKQKKIENRLNQVIKNSGKSLKIISEETQIHYQTLTNYKKGKRTPKNDTMQKLADYFGVSTSYLLGIEGKGEVAKLEKIKAELTIAINECLESFNKANDLLQKYTSNLTGE